MATHDYALANQSGSSFRTDLNNVLAAIVSNNSASSEPSTKYAYQYWADTSGGYLKIRNAANNAWIQLFKLDGTLSDIPVEGTVIKSTGESGGTKFLREDGDNSCSWQSISTTALTGSTNNTICTVTGANAIQGESTFTYDAGALVITGDSSGDGISIINNGDHYTSLNFDADRSAANNAIAIIEGKWNNTVVANIRLETGDDTTNKDDGEIAFSTTTSGGSIAERLRITSVGSVGLGLTSPDRKFTIHQDATCRMNLRSLAGSTAGIEFGDTDDFNAGYIVYDNTDNSFQVGLNGTGEKARITSAGDFHTVGNVVMAAAGKGIDFSDTSDAAGATSEVLDDYEEGTWTPTLNVGTATWAFCKYVRIGRQVQLWGRMDTPTAGSSDQIEISGIPFNANQSAAAGSMMAKEVNNTGASTTYINSSHKLYFYGINASNSWTSVTFADCNSNTEIYFEGVYLTD